MKKKQKRAGKPKTLSQSLKIKPEQISKEEQPVFVRIPGAIQGENIPLWLATADELSYSNFQRGDSLAAWRAFKTNMDQGCYPSTWVLEWLYKVFSKYEEGKGNPPLEKLFGFQDDYQGASTIFEINETNRQNSWLALQVASLVGFGKKPGKAISLVADKMFLNAGTVRNIYYRMKKKYPTALKEIEENCRRNPRFFQEEPFKHFKK
jgi:hypothetical protein